MSLGAFIALLTIGAAVLALWTVVRFPSLGPQSLAGAIVQIAIAFAAGWLLVPPGITAALGFSAPTGPLLAIFVFALPSLAYLFLTSLWAMRVLQQMMRGARR